MADTPNALMWCVLEINFSIIGSCAPTIKPLLRKYLPFILGRSSAKGTSYGTRGLRTNADTINNKSGYRLESLSGKDEPDMPMIGKGFTSTKIGTSVDDSSEEFIFQTSGEYTKDAKNITRTVQLGMTYEDEDDKAPHGR